jgi:hypothetical protein
MLDSNKLQKQLQQSIQDIIIPAIEQLELKRYPYKNQWSERNAKEISKLFDNLVSEPLAKVIADAIDCYIKNANVTGTIITTGSPTTQVARINPAGTPTMGGKIPNTFGIN